MISKESLLGPKLEFSERLPKKRGVSHAQGRCHGYNILQLDDTVAVFILRKFITSWKEIVNYLFIQSLHWDKQKHRCLGLY
jgi:hypothetical protein